MNEVSEYIRTLVQERTGIVLCPARASASIDRFIDGRTAQLKLPSPIDYWHRLKGESIDGVEFSLLISVITNGQTCFFRDVDQFSTIRAMLGELSRSLRRPLWLWSAACSTGEEAYSLALVCADLAIDAHVFATDINLEFLQAARTGHFSAWSLRYLPTPLRQRYFRELREETYAIDDTVKQYVTFSRHNLIDQRAPRPSGISHWDLMLCRNVFIYFERATVERVGNVLASVLAEHGALFLGASENFHGMQIPLKLTAIGSSFGYKKSSSIVESVAPPRTRAPYTQTHLKNEATSSNTVANSSAASSKDISSKDFSSNEVLSWLALGHRRLQAHQMEEALNAYEAASLLDPLMPEIHYFQGLVFRKTGDLEQAERALRRALFLEPRFWPASFLLAGIYGRLNKLDRRRQLSEQTLHHLDHVSIETLFKSTVRGMKDVEFSPEEIKAALRR